MQTLSETLCNMSEEELQKAIKNMSGTELNYAINELITVIQRGFEDEE